MENASLLRLEPAGKKDKKYLKALYKRAFPRAERKPFYMFGKKSVFLYIIKYGGAPAGLMAGCEFKDMLFIDYFAIDESMRGKGLGGQALSLLFSRFPGSRIFLAFGQDLGRAAKAFITPGISIRWGQRLTQAPHWRQFSGPFVWDRAESFHSSQPTVCSL